MRLGVAYNVFDGTELLLGSMRCVRPVADFICVVWQDRSNMNEALPVWAKEYLNPALEFADFEILFRPNGPGGHINEIAKRNMGVQACVDAGCTHVMVMDADEYYDTAQLSAAFSLCCSGDYDSSACQMQTYYGNPEYCMDPPENYYVPLIYKLDGRRFSMSQPWPVLADPTRKMSPGKIKIFERKEIEMHHFSYVRVDLGLKLRNSSAVGNFRDRVGDIVGYYESWVPGQAGLLAGKETRYCDLKKTENKFGIKWTGNR